MQEINIEELLKAGVHFGHQTSRWHPKMKPFIFTVKNKVHIIDLEKTQAKLAEALSFVEKLVSEGKSIMFLGTKKQAKETIEKAAKETEMPYVSERWLGGTFTNFSSIRNLAKKLTRLKKEKETGALKKYTKKEQLDFEKETTRLNRLVGGIETMDKLPEAIFVVGAREEDIAILEAAKKKVPVIALVDTNVDPTLIDYPIPANDDATKSIELIVNLIKEAVVSGKKKLSVTPATPATKKVK